MATLREQIRSNSVALISLSVAFIALSYNTHRIVRALEDVVPSGS